MLHPLMLARLEEALARPGCPVCWEMERASPHYLARLLREHKGSEGVWQRLRKNWGLCLPHVRLALDLANRPDTVELLCGRFLADLEVLAIELETFLDAHTPGGADRADAGSDVWLRAAERFAGKPGPGA